ncbi:MAG: HD domain-containing protein [Lachnospiraceae bacterium]|nr:HD domain-containing protein [Lachnospiraceae bacterium]
MSEQIVILHRDEEKRKEMAELIEGKYEMAQYETLDDALPFIQDKDNTILAILIGLTYPDKMGAVQIKNLAKLKLIDKIPVIAVSDEDNKEVEQQCYALGIKDFVSKPFYEIITNTRVKNVILAHRDKLMLEGRVSSQNEMLNKQIRLLSRQTAELDKSNNSIIEILGTVVECRNLENGNHVKRVKDFTRLLAKCWMESYPGTGLTGRKVEMIASASALHDVGKIAIPDSILLKPGKLTDDEFTYMKSHTIRGEEIVETVKGAWDPEYAKECAMICRWHHERYDGRGYPDGLKGDNIPLGVHCVALADVYDVLLSERVYKAAYTPDEAFHMIVQGECGVFAPRLIECFTKLKKEFEQVHAESIKIERAEKAAKEKQAAK